jgi:hypothetical protein
MCPCSNTPISKRKLLEPKSMAANNCPFCISILQSCSNIQPNFLILCLNFVILMTSLANNSSSPKSGLLGPKVG